MAVEIVHPLPVDEVKGWAATMATAFLEQPGGEEHERWVDAFRLSWDAERRWGARADGRWVGTLGSWDRTLTVPAFDGKPAEIPADALAMVSVAATHRRRGLLTAMLTDSLRAARERGDAVSILFAAEWSIYGRFAHAVRRRQRPAGGPRADGRAGAGHLRHRPPPARREHQPSAAMVGAQARPRWISPAGSRRQAGDKPRARRSGRRRRLRRVGARRGVRHGRHHRGNRGRRPVCRERCRVSGPVGVPHRNRPGRRDQDEDPSAGRATALAAARWPRPAPDVRGRRAVATNPRRAGRAVRAALRRNGLPRAGRGR